ncbi:ABC transporter permease [Cupriavidus sp. AU9028]|uniref:ABC transporter permease n=1 Tax=Cupriavidus sp. AU9028 TaxID=2871157 RepID=UPI001C974030|nr:ABC transporter permease [Cupriavidus sp. AU9028]MBY4897069.1 ABC transporter permease [Cupriavidus sp. AU9028]
MSAGQTIDMAAAPDALLPRPPRRRDALTARKLFGLILPCAWLALALLAALLAPWLPIADPTEQDLLRMLQPPEAGLWFGADSLGRDVLARTLFGLRVTFAVAVGAVALGVALGGLAGMLAGYFRGNVERLILACNNVLMAFPPIVLTVALMAYPGAPLPKVILALGLVFASAFTRITRVNTMMFAQQDFVTAARAIGMRDMRIMAQEIVPNLVTPLLVFALLMVAVAAVAEGTLSFLGLSVPPPTPTLGGMIASEVGSMREAPHAVFFPAAIFFLTIFALNRVGEYVQRQLDVRESSA